MRELLPIVAALRAERIRQGRNPIAVAYLAGYSDNTFQNYESGRGDPSCVALGRWANALGYELELKPVAVPAAPTAPAAPTELAAETAALFQEVIGLIVEACGYDPATVKAKAKAAAADTPPYDVVVLHPTEHNQKAA
jgi:transcriptional regulator with XRE-family HTH domain